MIRSLHGLYGYNINALDGAIGNVHEFYFDEKSLYIRYLVVDTGTWLTERLVLIPPFVLGKPQWASKTFPVNYTKAQILNSPPVYRHIPVSLQTRIKLHDYFGWPIYWGEFWQNPATDIIRKPIDEFDEIYEGENMDPNLRSTKEVEGYAISAKDGKIGHIKEFIADDKKWKIVYFVVDTKNWMPGKKVLISTDWIECIDWGEEKVKINLSMDEIKNSPEFNPKEVINREYETRLYDYYGRPAYWDQFKEKEL